MARTERVASLGDPRLDVFARLTDRQLRARVEEGRGICVVESPMAVEVALDEGVGPVAFLVAERQLASCGALLDRAGDDVPAFVLPEDEASRLVGYPLTRGFLCAMRRPPACGVAEVVAGARHVVVAEDLVDVSNVGALVRSAAALGADALVLSPGCADPLSRRAIRVSMGTCFKLPWARAAQDGWPEGTFALLHAEGLSTCALALAEGALPLGDPALAEALGPRRAVVLGSEAPGLGARTLACCDEVAVIPMARGVDSLNVAAAGAVAFWQLFCEAGQA